jgi:Trk-type K+ transport system membrane component
LPILTQNNSNITEDVAAVSVAVSVFSLSYIEYLGIIGICVFVIMIVGDLQQQYEIQKQNYIIKSNTKVPTLFATIENVKNNFVNNITSIFNNSIEFIHSKYGELKYKFNKWRVNSHLEKKTIKTIDISYYKDKYK